MYRALLQSLLNSGFLFSLLIYSSYQQRFPELETRLAESNSDQLDSVVAHVLQRERASINCLAILFDPYYSRLLHQALSQRIHDVPHFIIQVKESEDLMSPHHSTVQVIKQVKREGCNFNIILLANGIQSVRLLQFLDRYRLISTRARFVLSHNLKLFEPEALNLWNKIINVIFINQLQDHNYYELTTVPFPVQIQTNLTPVYVDSWKNGHFLEGRQLFLDKTNNMQGYSVNVATFSHIPSTIIKYVNMKTEFEEEPKIDYSGLEIEIIKGMGQAMNFQPQLYEIGQGESWGKRRLNGSYTGLLGEVMSGRAQIAVGGLQHTLYNLQLVDLSRPYMTHCLTFLTPESRTDNSWKTLVLPFMSNVWIPVFITFFLGGFIFFLLAHLDRYLYLKKFKTNVPRNHYKIKRLFEKINFGIFIGNKNNGNKRPGTVENKFIDELEELAYENTAKEHRQGLFLFEGLGNSILYTYGMLLSVSLPTVPNSWVVRIMTGWWWFYCLLIIVSYRASLTAILAKPEPLVTIDTLYELVNSQVRCGGWGEPEKLFFTTSFDSEIHQIGLKFEIINDTEVAVDRVAKGEFAYYENTYFLLNAIAHHESTKNQTSENKKGVKYKLHIMSDCIILMPISIGLEKNSPLKPRIDEYIQRVVEAGLIHKWLSDVMLQAQRWHNIYRTVQVEALMDLSKFSGALAALGFGYVICVITIIGENFYWYFIVKKHPLFDKYSMSQLYFNKRCQ